jgi:hypothetical protein
MSILDRLNTPKRSRGNKKKKNKEVIKLQTQSTSRRWLLMSLVGRPNLRTRKKKTKRKSYICKRKLKGP